MMDHVLRAIEQRDAFLLTSHARPDGDAIGSVLALYQMLRHMGKTARVIMNDSVPLIYGPLPYSQVIERVHPVPNDAPDTAIILECDSIQRTRLEGLEGRFLINIDHHTSARCFADVNWIDSQACAVAEMVHRLAGAANVGITPEMATCLYTAVLTDTGSFCFAGTGVRTFELAVELVRAGANPVDIAHRVYFSNPASKMRLLGAALSNLHRDGALAYMHLSLAEMERSGGLEEDCEGLVNYALSIDGVEVAMFFRELADGRYRVSLRSKGQVNVGTVAEQFGGGGHVCASGCAVAGPLATSLELMLTQLRSVSEQSTTKPEATA
ncbi:MAG: bifunctional oligoribonuclease/PAP phosphatase NrnA [Acidobacteria bacterium]|nr:bifunctional oligoribonuclease/PAP phosphatase NrnA [Acidobacteriota bacterium]MBV9146046.1 bifunctional oligoribonuclease/PAP phosphatase NrnA [Acidobacteriota bacterium]MBV9435966.1 bifunctional oligoribonuclease/PAP phosphatase NrnA [Acidobacteriota bacterium]